MPTGPFHQRSSWCFIKAGVPVAVSAVLRLFHQLESWCPIEGIEGSEAKT